MAKVQSRWLADKENNLYVCIDDLITSVERAVEMGVTTPKLLEVFKVEAKLAKNSYANQQPQQKE